MPYQNITLAITRFILAAGILLGTALSHAGGVSDFVITLDATQGDLISKSQVTAAESATTDSPEHQYKVSLVEEFRSSEQWFLSLKATNRAALDDYLAALEVTPINIEQSLNIVTPELGGGPKAGEPKDGHKVYVIEREIPGIGLKPVEELTKVSQGSQSAIEKIGDGIEWDHSYTTDKGTYCVYRATDPALIMEHANTLKVPANPTEVEHLVRNFEF